MDDEDPLGGHLPEGGGADGLFQATRSVLPNYFYGYVVPRLPIL